MVMGYEVVKGIVTIFSLGLLSLWHFCSIFRGWLEEKNVT